MTVDVVIPNRDGGAVLPRCLDALAAARGVGEVVVVDDGSTDGSAEHASRREGVVVITSTGRGFAAAANRGLAATSTELVLLLNSDAFVRSDTADRLAGAMAERPGLALVGAGLLDGEGRRAKSRDRALTLARALREALSLHYPPLPEGSSLEHVRFLPLACVLVRRSAWEAIGGLDERFRFYYEDHDLCWRLIASGWELAVLWDAEAVHVGGASSITQNPSGWFRQYHESRTRYLRKRYPRASYLYSSVWLLNALVHSLAWTARGLAGRDPRGLAWAGAYLRAAIPR